MFNDITLLFCFIDDFCKEGESNTRNYLLLRGKKVRKSTRVPGLEISEIITVILLFFGGVVC
jgi:hypothetical protein